MKTPEEEVEFGLHQFDGARIVEIPLRDALYAFKVIGKFVAFFHQPMHWRSIEDVERFIGTKDEGALHVLWEAYYHRLRDVWPQDVQDAFNEGTLDRNPFLDKE